MKPAAQKAPSGQDLYAQLSRLPGEESRKAFLASHRQLLRPEAVTELAEAVRQQVRVDVGESLKLAEAALAIAEALRDKEALARALRAKANALWFMGQCRSAVDLFEQAGGLFEQAGKMDEVGRTLSTSIQSWALLGEYDHAFAVAQRARQIFRSLGEMHRLARLEINVANIYHRQDHFAQALASYELAYQQLLPHKDMEGIGVALHNMAVCLIALNDFRKADEAYRKARQFCNENSMPLLAAQADYNIAYLHYLRGDYTRSIEILQTTRESCKQNNDAYHLGLCDLDQSEIYLELNLIEEAARMSSQAFEQFQQLGMGYEAARSLINLAIAFSQKGNAARALELFAQARVTLVQEKNQVWPSLLDLYQALVLFTNGEISQARRLCSTALDFFHSLPLPRKAVLCHLLLARISMRTGDLDDARRNCKDSLSLLAELDAPVLHHQAHFLMGQIQEASQQRRNANISYQAARRELETLRSSLQNEELKIGFMKNRLEVYERLVQLRLSQTSSRAKEEAFSYMEEAKSRSLRDQLFGRAQPLPVREPEQRPRVSRIRELREELNWYYHRIEREQFQQEEVSPLRIQRLQAQASERENKLLRLFRELPVSTRPSAVLRASAAVPLEEIRAALGTGTTLVEYFRVEERIVAAVLTRRSLEIVPLGPISRVTSLLRMLQFQFSKFRLGSSYVARFKEALLEATRAHLSGLYSEVLQPLRNHLRGRHLVVAPHDALHYLPFHALFDGRQYLIDTYSVSYAPSASIYALCHHAQANSRGASLILGVPDARAPFIHHEVRSVAAVVAEPELVLGPGAGAQLLKERGPSARLIHIATHGYFRQDNPMFSGIRLGDSYLSVYELYDLNLPVELFTLSGCATGLNVVAAGDELLGLARGLLCAGAQSLLLSLWDVDDRSTAEFMKSFYSRMQTGNASALQGAMLELRAQYSHPYYWAPFVLVGKITGD